MHRNQCDGQEHGSRVEISWNKFQEKNKLIVQLVQFQGNGTLIVQLTFHNSVGWEMKAPLWLSEQIKY